MGLDSVELVMHVEEEFEIEIPDDEASAMRTVGQVHECIIRLITAKADNAEPPDRDAVMRKLVDIVVMQLSVKPDEVTPNARFVEDLGIDRICRRLGI